MKFVEYFLAFNNINNIYCIYSVNLILFKIIVKSSKNGVVYLF